MLTLPTGVCVAGVDVGSTLTKVVAGGGDRVATVTGRTEADYVGVSARLLAEALAQAGRGPADLACVVATGYGRRRLPFADRDVTEITCHARGVRQLFPGARTVIDIGGQDAKGIKLGPGGKVVNFVMNDKCAAGTGRFLEVIAATLGLSVADLGALSLRARAPATVSSVCTVFAQQEVAQRLAEGVAIEDVLAGLHAALASRVYRMVRGLRVEPEVVLTGGCAHNPGLVRALEERLGARVTIPPAPLMTGALGAALLAAEAVERGEAPENGHRAAQAAMAAALEPGLGRMGARPRSFASDARARALAADGTFAVPSLASSPGLPLAAVDVGALLTKAVVVDAGRASFAVLRSEGDYAAAAQGALARALRRAGLARAALGGITATGLGAAKVSGARELDEVSCLARGAICLFPDAGQVIDIGGNGTRVIRLGSGGRVRDFTLSGVCAAGSARILEVLAHLLGFDVDRLGEVSLRSRAPAAFSVGCAVFAETEAVSLLTRGVAPEDLLAGLHRSMADKILALARADGGAGASVLAGGGAKDTGLVARLVAAGPVLVPPEPMALGALGAALLGAEPR